MLEQQIEDISNYALSHRKWLETEEAVKTSIILRVFSALGYDIHDPREVVPEFSADVGTKRHEKVDYAIILDRKVQIIVECKAPDVNLSKTALSQLFRYYSTTEARFAILTNGFEWQFFADTEARNRMDLKPFLRVDFTELTPDMLAGLARFSKMRFDPDAVARAAINLRTDREIMREIASELANPSEEFVKLITRRVYGGRITERVLDEYETRVQSVMRETLQEIARVRAELLVKSEASMAPSRELMATEASNEQAEIVTTKDEIEGFEIALEIASSVIAPERVVIRDQKTYCSILIDNNNRKPLIRMWFNNADRMQVEFFDQASPKKVVIRYPSDLRTYAQRIRATAQGYARAVA